MFIKKSVGLVAAAVASMAICGAAVAAQGDSTMTVSATLTSGCTVSATSAIDFGTFAALASTGDKTANSGSTFQVACSASATPTIFATGTREMVNGASVLPFNLSLTAGAASDDLASDSGDPDSLPGSFVQDGDVHNVVIYGKTLASNFKSLPSGAYSTNVTVSVLY